MNVSGPEQHVMRLPRGRFSVRAALGGATFNGRASKRGPKLYVIRAGTRLVYVGVTIQPIASRLRVGWSASGANGYYGYAWRKAYKRVGLDLWYPDTTSHRNDQVD